MWIDLPTIRAMAEEIRALSGDDDQTFLDTLDGETGAAEIAERLVADMREAAAMAEAAKAQARALSERAARFEARAKANRAQLGPLLDAMGRRKLVLPAATISRTKGRPRLVIDAPDDVPTQLCRIKREPDRDAIEASLKSGETVPGARLEAGPETVTVRV
jgi:hypothetical protein